MSLWCQNYVGALKLFDGVAHLLLSAPRGGSPAMGPSGDCLKEIDKRGLEFAIQNCIQSQLPEKWSWDKAEEHTIASEPGGEVIKWWNASALLWWITLAPNLANSFSEKRISFQHHRLCLWKEQNQAPGHIGSAIKTHNFFDLPSSTPVNKKRKNFVMKSPGIEKNSIWKDDECFTQQDQIPFFFFFKHLIMPSCNTLKKKN